MGILEYMGYGKGNYEKYKNDLNIFLDERIQQLRDKWKVHDKVPLVEQMLKNELKERKERERERRAVRR